MANYSGNLVRTFAHAEESANFAPDPAHAITDTADPYGSVHQVSADTGAEFTGTDIPVDVAVGGGSILDVQRRSHQGLAGRRMVYTDDQHRESLADRHGEDGQRGYIRETYNLPMLQDAHAVFTDTFEHDNTWGEHANNVGAISVLRGNKTSIPQNNPEGVREGMIRQLQFRMERRLGRRKYVYNPQQLIMRGTYQDANVPAPANPDPTAAGSVLDSWQPLTAFTRNKRPALYRTPPAVDESSLAAPDLGDSGVIGGGF